MKPLSILFKSFLFLFLVLGFSLSSGAMVKDSSKIAGPAPKKTTTDYKPIKISLPSQSLFEKADQEIIKNIETDIRELFFFHFNSILIEMADKEIDQQFFGLFKLSLSLPFKDSDEYINKSFNMDLSCFGLK